MKKILFLIILFTAVISGWAASDCDSWHPFRQYTQRFDFQNAETGLRFAVGSIDPFEVYVMGSGEIHWVDLNDFDCVVKEDFSYSDFEGLPENEYSGNIVIPDYVYDNNTRTNWRVTRIGLGCFNKCTELTTVTLPKYLTSVRRGAFNGCTALTEVIAPAFFYDSRPYPGAYVFADVFKGCTSLRKVDLRFAKKIYWGIFRECPNLEEVHMYCADNETEAFVGREVPSLKKLYIYFYPADPVKQITGTNRFFAEEYESTEVIVPNGQLERFKAHPVWGRFKNLHEEGAASVEAPQAMPEWEIVTVADSTFRILGDFQQGAVYTIDGIKMADLTPDSPEFTITRRGMTVVTVDGSSRKILF